MIQNEVLIKKLLLALVFVLIIDVVYELTKVVLDNQVLNIAKIISELLNQLVVFIVVFFLLKKR